MTGHDTVRRRRRDAGTASGEDGFTIVETMVALGIIFGVLLALLTGLDTGVRGLLTGRQRTTCTALAKQVIEQARASSYDDVGHALSTDATLTSDPAVTGSPPNLFYTPQGASGAEPLVGSARPLYPQHQWAQAVDATECTTDVYVTGVTPPAGDAYKRLTVVVTWANAQYGTTAVPNVVRLSTFVSKAQAPAGALTNGSVDVDLGSATVTGTLAGIDLAKAQVVLPLAHGELGGRLVDTVRGTATSAHSTLQLDTGNCAQEGQFSGQCPGVSVPGPLCSVTGLEADCTGVKAETVADSDAATAPPFQQVVGPLSDLGGTLAAGSGLSVALGAGNQVTSQSSAQSGCCSPLVGDGDRLPYAWDQASGPASASIGFTAGALGGNLLRLNASGLGTATVDVDPVNTARHVISNGTVAVPAADVGTLGVAGVPCGSAVSVTGATVTAQSEAGPTAAPPSVSGSNLQVTVCDTGPLGVAVPRTFTVTPGVAFNQTASATFHVNVPLMGDTVVSFQTTVQGGQPSTSSTLSGGNITTASANLSNWMVIHVRLTIQQGSTRLADLNVDVNYGRLATSAQYQPGS